MHIKLFTIIILLFSYYARKVCRQQSYDGVMVVIVPASQPLASCHKRAVSIQSDQYWLTYYIIITAIYTVLCSNGKKEEPERSVSERRRREARRSIGAEDRGPKGRRVSMQLGGLGSAVSSSSGSGRSLAAKRHLVHFGSENSLSGKALKGYCKCLLTKHWQQIVPSHFRVRLIHREEIFG